MFKKISKGIKFIIDWILKLIDWITRTHIYYYIMTVQGRIFDRHKLTTNAAAIAFFFLLSIIPILFFVVSILGAFVQSPEEAEVFITKNLIDRVPEGSREFILQLIQQSKLIENVKTMLDNKGWVTLISIGSLLWTSSGAFAAIEDAMTTIFSVKGRNYFVSRLVEMSMVLIIGSMFLTSNVINMIIQSLKESEAMMFGIDFANLPYVWEFMTSVMPYFATIIMFYMIYKILPKTQIYIRAALLGAMVAGLLLELTIYGFAYYVKNFGSYDVFYGSVAGIIIIIFCIYLASIILLIGAEITEIANTKIENKKEMELTFKEFETTKK